MSAIVQFRALQIFVRVSTTISGQHSKNSGIESGELNSGIPRSKLPIDFSRKGIAPNRPCLNLFLEIVEVRQGLG